MQFLTDYQERTRKGQGKDGKRTKGQKRTSDLFLWLVSNLQHTQV